MSDPMRHLDNLPLDEQTKVLREILDFLTKLVYTEILPTQSLEAQIETLKVLDRVERIGPESTATNDDADMLTEVMREAEAILL